MFREEAFSCTGRSRSDVMNVVMQNRGAHVRLPPVQGAPGGVDRGRN